MSDTPRTDAAEYESQDEPVAKLGSVDVDFARQLERELNVANDRIRLLIAERDTARLQADQRVSLREEFRELLGTDDVQEGITVVCDLKQLAAVRLGYIKQLETENDAMRADLLFDTYPQTIVRELNRMADRIKRLEEAGDDLYANCDLSRWDSTATTARKLSDQNAWRKAKEDKP